MKLNLTQRKRFYSKLDEAGLTKEDVSAAFGYKIINYFQRSPKYLGRIEFIEEMIEWKQKGLSLRAFVSHRQNNGGDVGITVFSLFELWDKIINDGSDEN